MAECALHYRRCLVCEPCSAVFCLRVLRAAPFPLHTDTALRVFCRGFMEVLAEEAADAAEKAGDEGTGVIGAGFNLLESPKPAEPEKPEKPAPKKRRR